VGRKGKERHGKGREGRKGREGEGMGKTLENFLDTPLSEQ